MSGDRAMTEEQREEAARLAGELTTVIAEKEAEARAIERRLFLVGLPLYVALAGDAAPQSTSSQS